MVISTVKLISPKIIIIIKRRKRKTRRRKIKSRN
jgi:hypothetical protein